MYPNLRYLVSTPNKCHEAIITQDLFVIHDFEIFFRFCRILGECEDPKAKNGIRKFGPSIRYRFSRNDCPNDVETTYVGQGGLLILAIIEFFISLTVVLFCSRAYRTCREKFFKCY